MNFPGFYVLDDEWRVIEKPRLCSNCGEECHRGETMNYQTMVFEREFTHVYTCFNCHSTPWR